MIKNLILYILALGVFGAYSAAFAVESAPDGSAVLAEGRSPLWLSSFRVGSVLSPLDDNVSEDWEHELQDSLFLSASIYRALYWMREQFHFFYGVGVAYGESSDKLSSGGGTARIVSDALQLLTTVGIAYQPQFLGGHFGGYIYFSYVLAESMNTELRAQGFTLEINNEDPEMLQTGLAIYYDINKIWRPFISTEGGRAEIVTLGAVYGF